MPLMKATYFVSQTYVKNEERITWVPKVSKFYVDKGYLCLQAYF